MIDVSTLMSAAASSGGAGGGGAGGAGAMAGAAGSLMSATPYGAAINAVGGMLQDSTPQNVTSGSGSYQSGPFTVGAKMVGGKGNSAGATTATASQTPGDGSSAGGGASSSGVQSTTLYVIIGAVVAVFLGVIFALSRRK